MAPTVVVIGSGPCGATAAHVLAGRGAEVVVLDAGLRAPRGVHVRVADRTVLRWAEPSFLSVDRHAAATEPATTWLSSWSLGGLSNYWTGAVPRFAPTDFTEGGRLDDRYRWPIGYEDLERHYDDVERLLRPTAAEPIPGVPAGWTAHRWRCPTPWRAVIEGAAHGDFPMGALPMAKGAPWELALKPREFDSYHDVLRRSVRAGAVRLVTGAQVLRIDHDHGRATGVRYRDRRTGTEDVVTASAVVVAAGALDSTHILLASTSSALPGGLGSSSGVLGRYLHDHPRRWYRGTMSSPLPVLGHPVYLARADPSSSDPLLAASATFGPGGGRDRVRSLVGAPSRTVGIQVFGTVVPRPDSRVELHSDDPARPGLRIGLSYGEAERGNMAAAETRIVAALAAGGIGIELDEAHDLVVGSSVHYGGTVRMHDDPACGVLDGWNRVYDAPNVIVCDASCFTTGPEKNPTLTAMAIASRAADRLADDLAV